MANKPHLLDAAKVAAAADGVHNDGGAIPGCALEIHVRNDGKSKRAYFRYNGTPFGEKRIERISLGPYDKGLGELRRECVACEELVRQGKSPKRFRERQKEERIARGMTLRQAMDEYYKAGNEYLWSPAVRYNMAGFRKNYLDFKPPPDDAGKGSSKRKYRNKSPADSADAVRRVMDMPIEDIRAAHIDEAFGKVWRTSRGPGARLRSVLHSALEMQIEKEDGVYRGPNPASWKRTSPLSRKWGFKPPEYDTLPGPTIEEVPALMAHFSGAMDIWVPGYLTMLQAVFAYGVLPQAIHAARRKLPGAIEKPEPYWKSRVLLYPIRELDQVFGKMVRKPEPQPRESAVLYSKTAQLVILTCVRSSMACKLRWRNIKEEKGIPILEYLPADLRTGRPSEHKTGWKNRQPYIVIATPRVMAIIEEMRQLQLERGIAIKPDGFVFMHSQPPSGRGAWVGKPPLNVSLCKYFVNAMQRTTGFEDRRITPDGMRSTFTTWATEWFVPKIRYVEGSGSRADLIDLTLGHIIKAIRENSTNRSYFYGIRLLEQRREMMLAWERHCLSASQPSNVVSLPRRRATSK
jgi:integrase